MEPNEKAIFAFDGSWVSNFDDRMQVVVPGYNLIHEIVASYLCAALSQKSDILVVGAATGADILALGSFGPEWQITGVDPSPEMLQIASQKLASAALEDRTKLECSRIEDLSDASVFDAAILSLVLQFYPDDGSKLELLRCVARHLKPNGCMVLIDSYGHGESAHFLQTIEALKIQTQKNGLTADEAEKDIESVSERFHLVSEERIRVLLKEAGYVSVNQVFQAFITGVWTARLNA